MELTSPAPGFRKTGSVTEPDLRSAPHPGRGLPLAGLRWLRFHQATENSPDSRLGPASGSCPVAGGGSHQPLPVSHHPQALLGLVVSGHARRGLQPGLRGLPEVATVHHMAARNLRVIMAGHQLCPYFVAFAQAFTQLRSLVLKGLVGRVTASGAAGWNVHSGGLGVAAPGTRAVDSPD